MTDTMTVKEIAKTIHSIATSKNTLERERLAQKVEHIALDKKGIYILKTKIENGYLDRCYIVKAGFAKALGHEVMFANLTDKVKDLELLTKKLEFFSNGCYETWHMKELASLGCEIGFNKGELIISKEGTVLVEDRPPKDLADISIIVQEVKRTLRSFNL